MIGRASGKSSNWPSHRHVICSSGRGYICTREFYDAHLFLFPLGFVRGAARRNMSPTPSFVRSSKDASQTNREKGKGLVEQGDESGYDLDFEDLKMIDSGTNSRLG